MIKSIRERWSWGIRPNIVADAAFHSAEVLASLSKPGSSFTCSVNQSHKKYLFEVLSRLCLPHKWLTVAQGEHLWSVQRSDDAYHFLATSAFSASPATPAPCPVVESKDSTAALLKKSKAELVKQATKCWIPSAGNKDELASRLSKASSVTDAVINKLEADLKAIASQDQLPAHHNHYRTHFNGVDLSDRYWYELQHRSNTLRSWRAKFILSLIEVGVVNAFALHSEFDSCTFMQFASSLSSALITYADE